jgi:lipopolysaccharide heptosyltransferase II
MVSKGLESFDSVLLILLGALGDVARGLSIPPAIKELRPGSKVTWLVEPASQPLVKLSPFVDEVIVFERKLGIRAVLRLARELRGRKFDLTLDLQRHFKSGLFSFFSRSKRRVGFHPRNSKEFNWIFNNRYIDYVPDSVSKIVHYQKFVEVIGDHPGLPLSPGIEAPEISIDLPNSGFICFVLGSSWQTKNWPAQGYRRLLEKVTKELGFSVVLLGAATEASLGEELYCASRKYAKNISVVNLAGKTTIEELTAILAQSALALGPDSGPGHICAMLGKRYISLFGPTSPQRVAPAGSEHLVVKGSLACSPCYRRSCPGLSTLCMRLLSPEAVVEKIKEALV